MFIIPKAGLPQVRQPCFSVKDFAEFSLASHIM